ncbi:16S rRNA (guanine(966)-N(2))-methyltransferase RsmD [Sodalis sp. CWE]|uniref:16S rRNA (guanine(966)-N(2))-methyltransferase RsmD n=1 Tax=Sodalis sp. CWE TaxID=2803816 RepID=UPI001C7CF51C|nr:16S rRNA (guanine(966)-N(2))-methyltransferase RsmD [Sodalis sp. CWE]MBX4180772.1 16S rRNA (guanine(966)-N(2))-methyltransferase RsmD [Sodalis sp. CWE]
MNYPNYIRIIGGKWRGRKLVVLKNPGLRPTSSRMRETLFNWLQPVIKEAQCLDCFAGTGALGFEALSRGVSNVTLLEINRLASKQLIQSASKLQTKKAKIITTNSLHWLARNGSSFNIVFIDPPFYHNELITVTINALNQYQRLKRNAWIYIETEATNQEANKIVPSHWKKHREKNTSQVSYRLYFSP